MGFCLFEFDEIMLAGAIDLGSSSESFDTCVDQLIRWLHKELKGVHDAITVVACEMPQFFQNKRGFDTATRGHLTEMCFCVGRVASLAESYHAEFIPVPVTKWKGQLKKPIVVQRIKAIIDTSKLTQKPSHDWDACGIGLYVKGKF